MSLCLCICGTLASSVDLRNALSGPVAVPVPCEQKCFSNHLKAASVVFRLRTWSGRLFQANWPATAMGLRVIGYPPTIPTLSIPWAISTNGVLSSNVLVKRTNTCKLSLLMTAMRLSQPETLPLRIALLFAVQGSATAHGNGALSPATASLAVWLTSD